MPLSRIQNAIAYTGVIGVLSSLTAVVVFNSVKKMNRKKMLIEKINKNIKANNVPIKSIGNYDILYQCSDYAIIRKILTDAKIYYLDRKIYETKSYEDYLTYTLTTTTKFSSPKYQTIFRSGCLDDVIAMYVKSVI